MSTGSRLRSGSSALCATAGRPASRSCLRCAVLTSVLDYILSTFKSDHHIEEYKDQSWKFIQFIRISISYICVASLPSSSLPSCLPLLVNTLAFISSTSPLTLALKSASMQAWQRCPQACRQRRTQSNQLTTKLIKWPKQSQCKGDESSFKSLRSRLPASRKIWLWLWKGCDSNVRACREGLWETKVLRYWPMQWMRKGIYSSRVFDRMEYQVVAARLGHSSYLGSLNCRTELMVCIRCV